MGIEGRGERGRRGRGGTGAILPWFSVIFPGEVEKMVEFVLRLYPFYMRNLGCFLSTFEQFGVKKVHFSVSIRRF